MQHFKAFIACHGAGRHAQELKVVEYVRFDTGKAGFRRAQTVGFNGKGDIFCFDKPVVALCKLVFQHIPVFCADRIESVLLCRDIDRFFRFAPLRPLIDERELHRNGSVKVVEEVAPVLKNGGLVVRLCKLVVYILKDNALAVFPFRHPAYPVRVQVDVGDRLLGGVRLSVPLCLSDNGGDLLLFLAGQFPLRFSLSGVFSRCAAFGCFL